MVPEKLELLLSAPTTRAFVPLMTIPEPEKPPSTIPFEGVPWTRLVTPEMSKVPLLTKDAPRLPGPARAGVPPDIVVKPGMGFGADSVGLPSPTFVNAPEPDNTPDQVAFRPFVSK